MEHKQKALEIMRKVLSPTHPDLAWSYNNMGSSLGDLGRYQEALEHLQKAIEIWEEVLPPNHPNLAWSYNNVGVSLSGLGRHQEALEYKEKALRIREKILPPNHSDLAVSHNSIALNLKDLGQHQEALEHSQKALEIFALQKKHPKHEAYLKNFIQMLNKQSDKQVCESAKQVILPLYTEKLGEGHALIQELKKTCSKEWKWW